MSEYQFKTHISIRDIHFERQNQRAKVLSNLGNQPAEKTAEVEAPKVESDEHKAEEEIETK